MVLPLDQIVAHRRFIRQVAGDLFDNPEDAEDLAQRVLLYALEKPPAHGRQIRGWLRVVTNHLAINLRSANRHRREREARVARQEAVEHEWAFERDDERRAVRNLVRGLSAPYRAPLELYYLNEMSAQEVAMTLKLPLNTVKTRLKRGRQQLLEAFGRRRERPSFSSWIPLWLATRIPRSRWKWSGVALGASVVPALGALLWFSLGTGESRSEEAALEMPSLAETEDVPDGSMPRTARGRTPLFGLDPRISRDEAHSQEDPRAVTHEVSFLVRDPDGQPLADMEVLFRPDAGGSPRPVARSGPRGHGSLSIAESGLLEIGGADWVTVWRGVAGFERPEALAEIVAAPRRALRGRVVDANGHPLRATVHVFSAPAVRVGQHSASRKGAAGHTTRSGEDGTFELEIGWTGHSTMRVHHRDYASWLGTNVPDGTTIRLSPKSADDSTSDGWIHGLVLDREQHPVPDAEVFFARRAFTTDADGRFSIPRMDHYQNARQIRALTRGAPPLQAFSSDRFGTTPLQSDPQAIHRIVLTEAAVPFEGYVRDPSGAPCADVEVAFREQSFGFRERNHSIETTWTTQRSDAITRTGPDGFFRIYGRPERDYVVRAWRSDGAVGELDAQKISEQPLTLAQPTQRALHGRVMDAAGNPAANAVVHAFDTQRTLLLGSSFYRRRIGTELRTHTNADGSFTLHDAPSTLDTVRVLTDGVLRLEAPLDAGASATRTLRLPPHRSVLLDELGNDPLVVRFYAGEDPRPLLLSSPSRGADARLPRNALVRWNGEPVRIDVPAQATHFVCYEGEGKREPLFTLPIPD